MAEYIIRKATLKDLGDIANLNRLLFEMEAIKYDDSLDVHWPFSDEGQQYFQDSINHNITYVACIGGKVVGYLIGSLNTQLSYHNIQQAELENMFVLLEYRHLGIGSSLFQEFLNTCRRNHIEEIKVVASYGNQQAIEFYKKNGFLEGDFTLKQKL